MNITINNFTPVKLLHKTFNWFSNKTKNIGAFFYAQISRVKNTPEKMSISPPAGKAWKYDPDRRNKVFQMALKQIRNTEVSPLKPVPKCLTCSTDNFY